MSTGRLQLGDFDTLGSRLGVTIMARPGPSNSPGNPGLAAYDPALCRIEVFNCNDQTADEPLARAFLHEVLRVIAIRMSLPTDEASRERDTAEKFALMPPDAQRAVAAELRRRAAPLA